jgi:protein-tyrosine kinase
MMTISPLPSQTRQNANTLARPSDYVTSQLDDDRIIGDIIREQKKLTDDQIESILAHQKEHQTRFGEAAIALGLASESDIVFALSQQFHYPYTPEDRITISKELVVANQPFGQQAEAFRAIRSQLMIRAFMAQLGGRVLIVDANFRGARLHELFGLSSMTGLSGILSGRQEDNVIYQAADIPSLFVMPVGITPPNPLELLERPAFRLLLSELLRKFDHVIVDTPAGSYGSDASVIASKCGAALMLVRKDQTRMQHLAEMVESIGNTKAKLVGIIANEI